jgi:hypothetical protein
MPTDYSKGKIYALRSYQTDDIYIGSTCQPLSKRMGDHRGAYKAWFIGKGKYTSFEILKYGDAYIELIQEIPCTSRMELAKYEGQYIRTMKCVNKCIAGRTKKEHHNDNYLKERQQHKVWNEKNKDKIKQQKKKWNEKNKDKVIKHEKNRLRKVKCDCGSIVAYCTYNKRHIHTKKHLLYTIEAHNELNHL